MTVDRKSELAQMCRLEIRRTVTLATMSLADYGYHLAMSVFDAEFQAMLDRLEDKPFDERDIPALMDLVMEELWPRLKDAHRKHRLSMFGKLGDENNDIIVRDADFSFDIGWAPLVHDTVERMRTYPKSWRARLDGGKEKFGCCVLFVSFVIDERGAEPEIRRMREEIRLRSLGMCEICGGQGRLRLGPWAKSVCDKHSAIFECLQEDDGLYADPWRWHEEQPPGEHIANVIAKTRALMAAVNDEMTDVQAGLDELDRGERVDIDDVIAKAHAIVERHSIHRNDPTQKTAISRQIEADIEKNCGRKADMLIEFRSQIESAIVAAMSVADVDVEFWLRSEVGRWKSVQPLSDNDRDWLLRYLRSLAIDELGRRSRRRDGAEALQRFLDDHPDLSAETAALVGRERELLDAYAGDLADSAWGRVVKEEYVAGYVREEIALWPDVRELSDDDRDWLRRWLRKMIDSDYERIRLKQEAERNND